MYKYSAKDIVRMLNQNIESVVKYLLPNGVRKNGEWCVGSVYGEPGESLKVHLNGDKCGVWCDFANATERGDLIDLWSTCRNLSFRETMLEAQQWLGITLPKFEPQKCATWIKPNITLSPLLPESSVANYLVSERKLNLHSLKTFMVTSDGNRIAFPYYRDKQLLLVKYLNIYRPTGKKQIIVTQNCEPCLFGWQAVPKDTRKIVLTEGEIDAISLFQ